MPLQHDDGLDVGHELRETFLLLGELVDRRGGGLDIDRALDVWHYGSVPNLSNSAETAASNAASATSASCAVTTSGGSTRSTRCWLSVHAAVTPRLSSSGMIVPPYPSLRS